VEKGTGRPAAISAATIRFSPSHTHSHGCPNGSGSRFVKWQRNNAADESVEDASRAAAEEMALHVLSADQQTVGVPAVSCHRPPAQLESVPEAVPLATTGSACQAAQTSGNCDTKAAKDCSVETVSKARASEASTVEPAGALPSWEELPTGVGDCPSGLGKKIQAPVLELASLEQLLHRFRGFAEEGTLVDPVSAAKKEKATGPSYMQALNKSVRKK